MKKVNSERLSVQHAKSKGVEGIFTDAAKLHEVTLASVVDELAEDLKVRFPTLKFRIRNSLSKQEINAALHDLDPELGVTQFVASANIKPDGGILEVQDDQGKWRVVLVSEAKFQGRDLQNIKEGKQVGKNNNQDLMAAGNAIERAHKNISEFANYMILETYFPYVLFLSGSNFLTETISVTRPDGRVVELVSTSPVLNRLDRLTAATYGMSINVNHCKNKIIHLDDRLIMLQSASIYTPNSDSWEKDKMLEIMHEVAMTSIKELAKDLFNQLSGGSSSAWREKLIVNF